MGTSSSPTNQSQESLTIMNPPDHLDESVQSADENICPNQEKTAHADTQRETARW